MKNMKIFRVCLCLTALPTLFANTYDYFQLVLTWPPTFCTAPSPCKEPIPQEFILNGLWQSNSKSRRYPWCTGPELNLESVNFRHRQHYSSIL